MNGRGLRKGDDRDGQNGQNGQNGKVATGGTPDGSASDGGGANGASGATGASPAQKRTVGGRNLTALAIRRPVTILMLLTFFVLAGGVGFAKLPVRRLPNVNFPFIRVVVTDPGATATTVAQTITDPIEKALSAESSLQNMVGTSSSGRSVVAMQFTGGTNVDTKAASVSLALQRLARSLPVGASPPSVIKANPNALPMMDIAISGPLAPSQLYQLATNTVAPLIQEVPGVAQVTVVGGRQPTVTVDVSQNALSAYGVSMSEVAAALKASNTAVTGGTTIVGTHEFLARVHGGYTSAGSLMALPVASRPGGAVLLGQVASVSQGLAQAQSNATLNGKPAVGLVVAPSSTASTLAVDNQVRAALAKMGPQVPAGVHATITGDVTSYVRAALFNVETDLFIGIFMAALVLALFLHRMSNTLIVMLAIPVSLVSTFSVMYFLGFSLDLISLMALSLLIGILVDDSIVVLENIHRHRRMGKSPAQAAVDGRMEIGAAAVAITLTDVVVYAPVAFVSGNVGQLFREFGLTIVAATLFSLLVSFTLTPMLASRFGDRQKEGSIGSRFGRRFDGGFDRIRSRYRSTIRWSLRHRLLVMLLAVGSLVASVGIVVSGVLPTTVVPPEDNGVLTINATLPAGTPLAQAQSTLASFAHRLGRQKGVRDVFVSAGYGAGGSAHNLGQVTLDLAPRGTRPNIRAYVKLAGRIAKRYPGLKAHGHVQSPFVAGGARAASIDIIGPDLQTLYGLANQISATASHSPAVAQVSTSQSTNTPELSITVNQAAAAYLGVDTTTIGSTVSAALGGATVPALVTSSTAPSTPVQLMLGSGSGKLTPAQLETIPVPTAKGGTVPLGEVANFSVVPGPATLSEINRQYSVAVSASSPTGNSGPATKALLSAAHSVGLPTGYSVQLAGQSAQQKRSFAPLLFSFALSLVLIYMLMAALYESLLDPFAVLLAVPLATVGALVALWLAGLSLSIFSLLALIMLMGLVSKNSILLVDYAKTLQRRGVARVDAIVESGATRIRPILMTTSTMIGAMLPLAISHGSGASQRMPTAWVLIGGLTSSTLLTLIVVPVLYSLLDDLRERLRRSPAPPPATENGQAGEPTGELPRVQPVGAAVPGSA
ncbi:MAG: efflux RND transporter permease subunit [Actinomycetota bacterium]|nr:efflux RND transporter permease subunit [Actinomycetota bacterium]